MKPGSKVIFDFEILFNHYALSMGLSTRALKPVSLDPHLRSGFNVVSRELYTARRLRVVHCTTAHCHAAQHAAWIYIEAVLRQSGLLIRIPDSWHGRRNQSYRKIIV